MPNRLDPKVSATDNVRVTKYDMTAVRERVPEWDRLSRAERVTALKACEPQHTGRSSNVTCNALHEYLAFVLTLDPDQGDDIDAPAEIAFGDDDTAFDETDTQLNSEVGNRISITTRDVTANEFTVDELLGENEQNGNTLRELGIFSDSGELYQHAPTDQVYEKDSSFSLLISIQIPINDA